MGKTFTEIGKIILTAFLSFLISFVVISQTIISRRATIEYVDKQDYLIREDMKLGDETLKNDFIREVDKLNETVIIISEDIKELLRNRK